MSLTMTYLIPITIGVIGFVLGYEFRKVISECDKLDRSIKKYLKSSKVDCKDKMAELLGEVNMISNHELERANIKFRLFASDHEAYATFQEEWDETDDERIRVEIYSERVWDAIKKNDKHKMITSARLLRAALCRMVAEAVQCIAMCDKLILSYESRKDGGKE